MSTKYNLRITNECKQNLKLCKRRGLPMDELWAVVRKLLDGKPLEEKYHAHTLKGDRKGQRGMSHSAKLVTHLGDT